MSDKSKRKQITRNGGLKFKFKKGRDEEIDRKRALETAFHVYQEWKKGFVNTPAKWEDIPARFNDLIARLEESVVHPDIRIVVTDLAMEGLVRSQAASRLENSSVMVAVNCPNDVVINSVSSLCPWAGVARFFKNDWENPAALVEMECPKCGGKIGRTAMKDLAQLEARAITKRN